MSGFGSAPGHPGAPQGYGSSPGPAVAQGYGAPTGQPAGASFLSPQGVDNALQMAKWMKVFGIINIVIGAIYCLSLAGAVVGWLPILMGYWKLKAAQDVARFAEAGDGTALESSFNYLRLYYLTIGIMMIVSISISLLAILGYIVMIFVFGMAMFGAAAAGGG